MASSTTELQDLVDDPTERLDAEYKSWLDFDDHVARANTARHIAAIANNGGGYLIFGITDHREFAGPNPFAENAVDHDSISAIVKKYLEPAFQCDVRIVKSTVGNLHPVVFIPPHGASPICAKANGPMVDGKPKGIIAGAYYTRKPGPASEAITAPHDWAPIIRRCALHERAAILGAIDSAIRGGRVGDGTFVASVPTTEDRLKTWHDAAKAAFLREVRDHATVASPDTWPRLSELFFQFSYTIHRADGAVIEHAALQEILRQVNNETTAFSQPGSWLFYPYTRDTISPRFTVDPATGSDDDDFLEVSLIRAGDESTFAPTFWRVSSDGRATIVDRYVEDQSDWCRQLRREVGSWMSPGYLVRSLAELVRHARGFSERFDSAVYVAFRCEWNGLKGRQVFDPMAHWRARRPAVDDRRVSTGSWPVAALTSDWATIVADLAAPVLRALMTDWTVTPEWVLGQSSKWNQ